MGLTRRALLQGTGLALTSLGVREIGLAHLSQRYQMALAQPTPRKLALLIGINQYPETVCDYLPPRGSALNGCLTDIRLQEELLIHRFAFQPADILTLTDQQATWQQITDAFQAHLIDQARSHDVVVFHFSGLGSRVRRSDRPDREENTLVPIDGWLPTEEHPALHDLFEDTLMLLLRSLPTPAVTAIFDLSYADSVHPLQGNLRVRARPIIPTGNVRDSEIALQESLRHQLKSDGDLSQPEGSSGSFPGIMLTAAAPDQGALEGQWGGFSAGLFTYALTQQLWQTIPPTRLRMVLGRTTTTMKQLVGDEQQPQANGQVTHDSSLLPYYLPDIPGGTGDGVITALDEEGKTIQLWMGGLPPVILDHYGLNALLSLHANGSGEQTASNKEPTLAAGLLQVRSREGLVLKAKLIGSDAAVTAQVGQTVCEAIRVLPRNISLVIALDTSLERIERVDATSAFAAIPRVSTTTTADQVVDYIFGKSKNGGQTLAASLAPAVPGGSSNRDLTSKGSYGLFTLGRGPIPNTLTQEDEAVKTAINRLTPRMRTLLATKLVRLTANSYSSRLGVRVTLEMVSPQERILFQQHTVRAPWQAPETQLASLFTATGYLPAIPVGSRTRYRVLNYSDRPVYVTLLGLKPDGQAVGLYLPAPSTSDRTEYEGEPGLPKGAIAPGETLTLPHASTVDWGINDAIGVVETHLIVSRAPLPQTTALLTTPSGSFSYRISPLANPFDVAQALLQDLHDLSAATPLKAELPIDTYNLNVNTWATFNLLYRVTATT